MDLECKGCSKKLNYVKILKHLASSHGCKPFYSDKELVEFRNQSTARSYARKRKVYDSTKRAKKYRELNIKSKLENGKLVDGNTELPRNFTRQVPKLKESNAYAVNIISMKHLS